MLSRNAGVSVSRAFQAVRQPTWAPTQYSPVELENASLLGPFFRVSILGADEVRRRGAPRRCGTCKLRPDGSSDWQTDAVPYFSMHNVCATGCHLSAVL